VECLWDDTSQGAEKSAGWFAGLHKPCDLLVVTGDSVRVVEGDWFERFVLLFEARPKLVMACPRLRCLAKDGTSRGNSFEWAWDWSALGFGRLRRRARFADRPYHVLCSPDAFCVMRRSADRGH
jgi:hypothetical protein